MRRNVHGGEPEGAGSAGEPVTAAPATATPAGFGWPVALLLTFAGIVSAFHIGKASAVLEVLQAQLGISLVGASWLVSASGVIGALVGAPVGLLVDRAGARRMTLVGLLVQAAASAVGALLAEPGWLLASRVVEGLGFQLVVVAAPALIATGMAAHQRPAAMAAWSTFMPIGLAAALLAPVVLPAQGWQSLWWGGTIAAGATALALRALAPESSRAAGAAPSLRQDSVDLWKARAPVLLAWLFALFNASYFAVFGFLPALLQSASQLTGVPTAVLSATAVAASAGGNLAGLALLARGVRPAALLVGSFLALAACSVPIVVSEAAGPLARYAASVAFGAVAGLIPAALFAEAPARAPRANLQGLVIGLMMQGSNVGLVAGPPLAAAVAGAFGWAAVAGLVGLLAALALAAVRSLGRGPARAASRPGPARQRG